MGRQKTFSHFNSKFSKLVIKILLGLVILTFLTFIFLIFIRRYLKSEGCFRIKDILTKEEVAVDLSYLRGINIFGVDLNEVSSKIKNRYPQFKEIIIQRYLPDRIAIDFQERKSIAKVKGISRYFFVDHEGMLLADIAEQDNLPIISGLEMKIGRAFPGKLCNLEELKYAIDLISVINTLPLLANEYRINKVDLSNGLSNMAFFIEQGPQIKIGQGDYSARLNMLVALLPKLKERLENIEYIDIRFKEPTVFPKRNGK